MQLGDVALGGRGAQRGQAFPGRAIANDEFALKTITAQLKDTCRDTGGDVAGVGRNMLMATPAGIKIDRNKIKGTF